jgi:hypothetical protein
MYRPLGSLKNEIENFMQAHLSNLMKPLHLLRSARTTVKPRVVLPTQPKPRLDAALIDIGDENSSAMAPQIAFDGHGYAMAVWQQHDGRRFHIWANRYKANVGWSVAQRIHTHNRGDAYQPQISLDSQGNALVVWAHCEGECCSVWVNHYASGLGAETDAVVHSGWGGAVRLQADLAGNDSLPQVTFDPHGNALAVWQHKDEANNISVWSNRYVAGTGWGALATMVEWRGQGEARSPQISFDHQGNAMMLWAQHDGWQSFRIWATRYQAGSGWCAGVQITQHSGNANNPHIAFDPHGNALVVFEQVDGECSHIGTTRYTAGAGWSTPKLLETDCAGDAYHPHIAMDASGCALLVWEQSDGMHSHIWTSRYVPGVGWGTAARLETGCAGNAYLPHTAMDGSGNAMVVWTHHNGQCFDLWAACYTMGRGWSAAAQLDTPFEGSAYNPQIAMDKYGNAMLVWEQHKAAHYTIGASLYGHQLVLQNLPRA